MYAQCDRASADASNRQRVVNFSGGRIINRKRLHAGQLQLFRMRWCLNHREARALGEIFKQKAFVMKLVGRGNGARALQQVQRRNVGGF